SEKSHGRSVSLGARICRMEGDEDDRKACASYTEVAVITPAGKISRRRALNFATASAALPLVHIRSGRAAGKLSVGFWDHWVPEGNEIMKQQCAAFASANQVDLQVDFITSVGSKNLLTIAAEAQAKTGHDIQQLPGWEVQNHADQLEPVDDIMQRLTAKYGNVAAA